MNYGAGPAGGAPPPPPPPDDTMLWVLERCLLEPGLSDSAIEELGIAAGVGSAALPEPLQCRLHLRGLEGLLGALRGGRPEEVRAPAFSLLDLY